MNKNKTALLWIFHTFWLGYPLSPKFLKFSKRLLFGLFLRELYVAKNYITEVVNVDYNRKTHGAYKKRFQVLLTNVQIQSLVLPEDG